jgi:hypothetical protein
MYETSHTFETEKEAKAFWMGYSLAHLSKKIAVRIDSEEPQTVLLDIPNRYEGLYRYWVEGFKK